MVSQFALHGRRFRRCEARLLVVLMVGWWLKRDGVDVFIDVDVTALV